MLNKTFTWINSGHPLWPQSVWKWAWNWFIPAQQYLWINHSHGKKVLPKNTSSSLQNFMKLLLQFPLINISETWCAETFHICLNFQLLTGILKSLFFISHFFQILPTRDQNIKIFHRLFLRNLSQKTAQWFNNSPEWNLHSWI